MSPEPNGSAYPVAAFGGGCHWCTEAVFQHVPGVVRVEQGFAGGPPPDDALSEAARVWWDASVVTLVTLVGIHLDTHAAQSDHSMRGKYRSAVYAADAGTEEAARVALSSEAERRGPLVTRVLPLARFERSSERYRDYYRRRPDAPFCRTHIAPKLARLVPEPHTGRIRVEQEVMDGPVRKGSRSV